MGATPRKDLVMEPTLRDLFVQHMGVNRSQTLDGEVFGTYRWRDWLAFAARTDDERLLDIRRKDIRFVALLTLTGKMGQWHETRSQLYEARDVYYTPGLQETEIRAALRSRRTEGTLRELMVADAAEAVSRLRDRQADPRLAEMARYGASDREEAPLPETPAGMDALSDWNLSDAWWRARQRLAFYEVYEAHLDRKAEPAVAVSSMR